MLACEWFRPEIQEELLAENREELAAGALGKRGRRSGAMDATSASVALRDLSLESDFRIPVGPPDLD